jgi:uncharacterized protein (TIGR00369 family)
MAETGFFAKILNGEMPEAPISKLLGWKYLSFDREARVLKVEMQARSEFLNPVGVIHGGMLDETLSPTLALTLGPGEFAPTLELKVNFIAPTKPDPVLGTGRIVHRGRSICFMEGQLHDDGGNLLATATATSKITTRPRA